jgi:hypothetical protein
MSGVSSRKRTATVADLKGPAWFLEQWNKFSAPRDDKSNDGAQECGAYLLYKDSAGTAQPPIRGETVAKEGHAEMNALNRFLRDQCGYDGSKLKEFQTRNGDKKDPVLAIDCTAKPCCVRCSIVLGALGFWATPGTSKTTRAMGSTNWGMHPRAEQFLRDFLGLSLDEFNFLRGIKLS